MQKPWPILLAILCLSTAGCKKSETQLPAERPKVRIQEGYSETFIRALQQQDEAIRSASPDMSFAQVQSIRSVLRTWPNKKAIKVAFKSGNAGLRKQISQMVQPWMDAANITFDFGFDPTTGNYREWTTSDTDYRADVRISFDSRPEPGYWSAVGKDSIKPSLRAPNIASMNFQGFTDELPDDWQATVLHELGHALGFEHEHQSPNSSCEPEYRWSDDPGYIPTQNMHHEFVADNQGRKPGIYTVLGGAPNRWSKEQIDFNLKQFAPSTDWYLTSFDPSSIMKYVFPDWMYRDVAVSTKSGCYGPPNLVLSAEDQKAAAAAYPRDPQSAQHLLDEKLRVSHEFLARKKLSPQLRLEFNSIAATLEKAKRQK
jgi:hypothetical protein